MTYTHFFETVSTDFHYDTRDDLAIGRHLVGGHIHRAVAETCVGQYKSVFLSLLRQRLRTDVIRYEWKDSEISIDSRFFHRCSIQYFVKN